MNHEPQRRSSASFCAQSSFSPFSFYSFLLFFFFVLPIASAALLFDFIDVICADVSILLTFPAPRNSFSSTSKKWIVSRTANCDLARKIARAIPLLMRKVTSGACKLTSGARNFSRQIAKYTSRFSHLTIFLSLFCSPSFCSTAL